MKAIDLFSGFGGSSTGASMAGIDVVWAGNHWQEAVGYYPKLSQVITALIMRGVMKSDIESLQAMQQHITRVSLACEKALNDFTSESANDEVA